jgi:hypothetical protein
MNVKSMQLTLRRALGIGLVLSLFSGCFLFKETRSAGRGSVYFIGVDISGSFMNGKYFKDAIKFLSHYIYIHVRGLGELEQPTALFVGSIGGAKVNELKPFFPIETFQKKTVGEIESKLHKIFPKKKGNPLTDFNAFFKQIEVFVQDKNFLLSKITIVMLSDGVPDAPRDKKEAKTGPYERINLEPLEFLSRNITLRLLYTDHTTGMNWRTKVKRQRVRIFVQDGEVMREWDAKNIIESGKKIEEQKGLFSWMRNNVDPQVRARRVD